jgi:hypothetical protein
MPLTPRPIVGSAPIRKQGWSQRSVPLRVRQQVQEMLRQGRLKSVGSSAVLTATHRIFMSFSPFHAS